MVAWGKLSEQRHGNWWNLEIVYRISAIVCHVSSHQWRWSPKASKTPQSLPWGIEARSRYTFLPAEKRAPSPSLSTPSENGPCEIQHGDVVASHFAMIHKVVVSYKAYTMRRLKFSKSSRSDHLKSNLSSAPWACLLPTLAWKSARKTKKPCWNVKKSVASKAVVAVAEGPIYI